jgi:hypothetical protein
MVLLLIMEGSEDALSSLLSELKILEKKPACVDGAVETSIDSQRS